MSCGVCDGKSGGEYVGVASIPGVPMSIGWCRSCLDKNAIPAHIAEHDFILVGAGDLEQLAPWARARMVWHDDKYMTFDEFCGTIPREEVEREIKEWLRLEQELSQEN